MIRVMIVDDQDMIRVGLRTILSAQNDIEVVADVGDALQAVRLLEEQPIDVVLMDIRMPGIDGVQATARIRQAHAADRVRIIILTTFEHDDYVVSAITAGANGFLGKGVAPSRLVAAIHEVVSGGGALSAAAAAVAMNSVAAAPKREIDAELASRFDVLTARERAVVIAAASGRSNEEIAGELFVSPFTVKTHANRAMAKVGARDRAQLVAFAHRAGIADET